MELFDKPQAAIPTRRDLKPLPLLAMGGLISALLVLNGLLFRTYGITMTSPSMEAARQLGLPYVIAEIGTIIYALRRGLDVREVWKQLPRNLRVCAIIFLAFFWVGSAFYSKVTPLAIAQNIIFLIHPLFAIAVYHSVSCVSAQGLRAFAVAVSGGLLIFCGMTASAFLNHPPLSTMPDNMIIWQFIIPGFISVRLFGAFCGAIFCFLLAQLLFDEERGRRGYLPYLWVTLCAAMTLWSGTRNAVLGIAVAMTILLLVYRLRPANMTSFALLILCAATAFLLATILVPYGDPTFMLIASHDSATAESISGGRASYWSALWSAYKSVPIFGAGPFASYWILPAGEQIHVQPHNIILQFLLSWGLLATVASVAMLPYATWRAHLAALRHRNVLPFLAMLDCLLVMSMFDGMAHFAQPLMLMMICFGVIFGSTKSGQTDTAQ
ncbi:MAG: O-antigen ligase family protein [Sphingorhabdus sp.]|uniref:O-antigen ligase family protein n=1 Tax=Sphingorhabdus sp. TaxID=1902408 RepID=UPI0025DAB8AB|nr:O-antigen ligase family protein [Sphingorhabdus sp.]MCO4090777.1 O-antigen ligase family protein [Sphingorhabdus sp.]